MATRQLSTKQVVNRATDPATGTPGELYYNTTINSFKYYNGTTWTEIVSGPSGLQNVVEDTSPELGGNLDASSYNITNVDNLAFDTTPDNAGGVGILVWDDGDGTLSLGLKGGNVNLQLGQEEVALCYNGTGSTLTEGTVVYIVGAQGQRPSLAKASANSESTSSKTFGVVTENIANGAEGFVTTFGVVRGLNTAAFTEGSAIWLSTTAGLFTQTMPTAPNHAVFIGYCIRAHPSSGEIFVKIQNGYELQELHNVSISSLQNGQVLQYNSSSSLWQNATPTSKSIISSTFPSSSENGQMLFYYPDLTFHIAFNGAWIQVGSAYSLDGGNSSTSIFEGSLDAGFANSVYNEALDGGNSQEEQIELLA